MAVAPSPPISTDSQTDPVSLSFDGTASPGPRSRQHLLLLQIIVTIVLCYHVIFGQTTIFAEEAKNVVVLGLMMLLGTVIGLPMKIWETNWFVAGLVVADTVITSGIIYFFSHNVDSGLYLTYFLIILIAAALPTLSQAVGFCALLCAAYGATLYLGRWQGLELSEGDLLQLPVLLIMGTFNGVAADTVRKVRRRSDQIRQESELRFRSVVQSAHDAIIVTNADGAILSWNRAAQTAFGYDEGEVLGKPLFSILPARHREAYAVELTRYLATGESRLVGTKFEGEGLKKDGSEFPFELSLATWETEEGAFFCGILRDISERKRIDESIRKREDELRHVQKMDTIGRLATEVAHDFNHILSIITGYSQLLLRRTAPEDPAFKKLTDINKAVGRGQALTQRLLTFGRPSPHQPACLDVNGVITDLTPLLERLVGGKVQIKTLLSAEIGPLATDAGQLEQMLMNLVANARDAMPHGGLVSIETAHIGDNYPLFINGKRFAGPHVALSVTDTGTGMTSDVETKCFEPFFTTKAATEGTGLGLATVRRFVEQMRGIIDVKTEVGRGTTFTVYLPQGSSPSQAAAVPAHQEPKEERAPTILVVDDDADVRAVIQEMLGEEGYIVLEASGGETALQLAKQYPGPIDLLLTDVMMPEMNGPELVARFARLRPRVKILYASAYNEALLSSYGVPEPGQVVLHKPFNQDHLFSLVRRSLDRSVRVLSPARAEA